MKKLSWILLYLATICRALNAYNALQELQENPGTAILAFSAMGTSTVALYKFMQYELEEQRLQIAVSNLSPTVHEADIETCRLRKRCNRNQNLNNTNDTSHKLEEVTRKLNNLRTKTQICLCGLFISTAALLYITLGLLYSAS